jgi:Flp pilus assembly protein TadD
MNACHRLVILAAGMLALAATHAADYGQPATPAAATAPADPLAGARGLIGQAKWREAIDELRRVDRPGSADWNNLMGYAHRKQAQPDLAAAQRYYDVALRLDPKHRGALEYSGELMLMKNDLSGAKARLSSLEAVCGKSCPETEQLKTAIAGYEAGRPRAQ